MRLGLLNIFAQVDVCFAGSGLCFVASVCLSVCVGGCACVHVCVHMCQYLGVAAYCNCKAIPSS